MEQGWFLHTPFRKFRSYEDIIQKVIRSVGEGNCYGHAGEGEMPSNEGVRECFSKNLCIFRTGRMGSVKIRGKHSRKREWLEQKHGKEAMHGKGRAPAPSG